MIGFICTPFLITAMVVGALKFTIKAGAFERIFWRKSVDADRELALLGLVNIACGLSGNSGVHWSFSNTNMAHEMGSSVYGAGVVHSACMAALWWTGISPLQNIPVFVYAALLADSGWTLVEGHLINSFRVYGKTELAILASVVFPFVFVSMLTGIGCGIILCIFLLLRKMHRYGTVRFEATGNAVRSCCERDRAASKILEKYGASVHIIRLQGFLFFATGADLVAAVQRRLDKSSHSPGSDVSEGGGDGEGNAHACLARTITT